MGRFLALALAGLLFLAGCASEEDTTKVFTLLSHIAGEQGGHFRGATIGDSPQDIVDFELAKPAKTTEEELVYRFEIPETDSGYFEVFYQFDQYGLFEIQVDIYLFDRERTAELFSDFRGYFNELYGESTMDSGYTTWKTLSKRKYEINVSLIDESEDYGYSLLSITFNEELVYN